ncbi:hypothetical protein BG004_002321 [Podila humilis]|nr:hypothetical protein BG004_002321 [Podila humilis]
MKFARPFLLLSLSMASAMILHSSAAPTTHVNHNDKHPPAPHSKPDQRHANQRHSTSSLRLSSALMSGTALQRMSKSNNNSNNYNNHNNHNNHNSNDRHGPSHKYSRAHHPSGANLRHRKNGNESGHSSTFTNKKPSISAVSPVRAKHVRRRTSAQVRITDTGADLHEGGGSCSSDKNRSNIGNSTHAMHTNTCIKNSKRRRKEQQQKYQPQPHQKQRHVVVQEVNSRQPRKLAKRGAITAKSQHTPSSPNHDRRRVDRRTTSSASSVNLDKRAETVETAEAAAAAAVARTASRTGNNNYNSKRRPHLRRPKKPKKNTNTSIDYSQLPTNTPLLTFPDPDTVWQAGSTQRIQWSRKYKRALPADTTVDIVLVNAQTNERLFSLKRYVPFARGMTQIVVPKVVPENVSFVLVLELYHGRSQELVVGSTNATAAYAPPAATATTTTSTTTTITRSSLVRRSDISISAARAHKSSTSSDSSWSSSSSSSGSNPSSNNNQHGASAAAYDGAEDFYTPTNSPYDFWPDEMRQEYPNVSPPLELEHSFGLHQKVYTLTPYTLEWKLPPRVKELLDYSKQLAILRQQQQQQELQQQQYPGEDQRDRKEYIIPSTVYMSKLVVELVKDQTLESAAVLARDIPAETRFLYLRIQARVAQEFYRLRVRMVVVEYSVNGSSSSSYSSDSVTSADGTKQKQQALIESGAFPAGGKVVDRFEAVTRRFWVTVGAL